MYYYLAGIMVWTTIGAQLRGVYAPFIAESCNAVWIRQDGQTDLLQDAWELPTVRCGTEASDINSKSSEIIIAKEELLKTWL